MMSSLMAMAAALAAQSMDGRTIAPVAPTPPPPVIVATSPPAPPPILTLHSMRNSEQIVSPATLDLRISASEGLLWEGSLRIGPQTGASISQSRSEASAETCILADYSDRSLRTSLSINIGALRAHPRSENKEAFNISVNWSRPSTANGCAREGSRTVQLQQIVEVDPRGSATLRGDAGLTVQIRRR